MFDTGLFILNADVHWLELLPFNLKHFAKYYFNQFFNTQALIKQTLPRRVFNASFPSLLSF